MQELNELIAEYRSKEEEDEKEEQQQVSPEEDNTKTSEQNDVDVKNTGVPMDKVIFGDKTKLIKNLEKAVTKVSKHKATTEKEPDNEGSDGGEKKNDTNEGDKRKAVKRKPVWTDADDEEIQLGEVKKETKRTGPLDHLKMDKSYKEHLTSRFTRIVNQPKWASLDEKEKQDSGDEDDDLLRTVGFLNKPAESVLTPGHLNMKRMKDLNRATYGEGVITSIQFHPTSTAALVTGDRGIATIYAIDGTQNDKLHNIHFPNFPIRCARLLPCGTKAIFGSVTRHAYLYDLMSAKETCFRWSQDFGNLCNFQISPCGRYLVAAGICGEIHIYEAKTFELIRTLKQNDQVASLCFTGDSQRLIVSGKSSNINVFSMRQQRLEHKFIDDGCIVGNAMDLSPNQRLLATGSREGVVNVYDFDKVMLSSSPQPVKTFLNLTTGISCVRFNHSSELLGYCSSYCKDAVKIAHFPSVTVFANFPGNMPKLEHVRTLEFDESPPLSFEVQIVGNSAHGRCRSQVDVIDRGDGTFWARYKIIDNWCDNVEIHVRYNGSHVAKSPYYIWNRVYSEKCYCPTELNLWMINNECKSASQEEQIVSDLHSFKRVNFSLIRDNLIKRYNQPESISLCHYIVKDQQIWRKCYGKYDGFKMFMDATLLALGRVVQLPDMEFFLNLGDWPLSKKGGQQRTSGPYPVFSWSGSNDSHDIVLPTYDITESTLGIMERVTLDMLSVQRSKYLWGDKIDKLFWRGRDSRRERLDLIDLARQRPDLIDAAITNFFFFRDEEQKYGPRVDHISFMEFFKPYQHYIPVKRDLSDLIDNIEWAKEEKNQKLVQEIAKKSREFAVNNLLPRNIYCYHMALFKEWSQRLVSPINVLPDMERVREKNACSCKDTHVKDEL
ncbi:U3 small nucleolar RNA-associated protein 18 like protein [Lucilia cuprina]|nr:U3 small nucleolar RNA-associated protein 18 like protein [Lucilia cuprina]